MAFICPLLSVAVSCATKDPISGASPSLNAGAGTHVPATAGTSGHTATQAGQAAATSGAGAKASGSGGAGAPASATGGNGGSSMPVPGPLPTPTGDGGTDAAIDPDAAADSGTGMPTTPTTFPPLTANQIGMPTKMPGTYMLAEGPVWDHCQKKMLFSDVNTQTIHTIEADGTIGVFRMNTNYVNALVFDPMGRLVQAEMGGNAGGKITRIEKDGTVTVLADKTPSGGTLNTSDDLAVRSDGTIYFSDPIIAHGPNPSVSITSKPLYRIPAGMPGTTVLEGTGALTNGVDLSADEKVLYVAEYLGGVVSRFDVAADGKLSGKKTFTGGLTNPDSMCLDVAGNVYVGVSAGLAIIRPDGTKITTVAMTTNKGVTNCGFGGEDGKTLYITAWASLWKIENMPVPGLDWTVNKRIVCGP